MRQWESEGEPIVVLKCGGEEELRTLGETAQALGLPVAFIRDAGRTQVVAGSVTVCAIGPAEISAIDAITGHLKLL